MFYLYFAIVIILNGYFNQIIINVTEYRIYLYLLNALQQVFPRWINKCFTIYVVTSYIFQQ